MISSTARERRPGQMAQVTKETMSRGRSTVMESSLGLMAPLMRDSSSTTISMEMVREKE